MSNETTYNRLVDFVSTTKNSDEKQYSFVFIGTVAEAKAYVQAMRAQMSRIRTMLRKRSKPAATFKMLLVSMEQVADTDEVKIVLEYFDPMQKSGEVPKGLLDNFAMDLGE